MKARRMSPTGEMGQAGSPLHNPFFQYRFPTYKPFVRVSVIMQDATEIFRFVFYKGLSSFFPDDLQIFINPANGFNKRVSAFIRMPNIARLFRIQCLKYNMVLLIAGKKKYKGKWTEYKTYLHQLPFMMEIGRAPV